MFIIVMVILPELCGVFGCLVGHGAALVGLGHGLRGGASKPIRVVRTRRRRLMGAVAVVVHLHVVVHVLLDAVERVVRRHAIVAALL